MLEIKSQEKERKKAVAAAASVAPQCQCNTPPLPPFPSSTLRTMFYVSFGSSFVFYERNVCCMWFHLVYSSSSSSFLLHLLRFLTAKLKSVLGQKVNVPQARTDHDPQTEKTTENPKSLAAHLSITIHTQSTRNMYVCVYGEYLFVIDGLTISWIRIEMKEIEGILTAIYIKLSYS